MSASPCIHVSMIVNVTHEVCRQSATITHVSIHHMDGIISKVMPPTLFCLQQHHDRSQFKIIYHNNSFLPFHQTNFCLDCILNMGKPGRDPRRSRVDLCRSRVDLCRSRVDVCRSEVKRKILIFSTICHCQKLKIFW